MPSGTLQITEKPQDHVKYPRSVGFIIGNEFCERFNYYGMRTILVLYLTDKLHYEEDEATVLFHIFTSLVYVFPLIGAVLADSWLGRFKTIWYLSLVYTFGALVIAIGAVPPLQLPVKEATMLGLFLIATGTGGIKPCVSAFGGDQFKIPEQAKQLVTFFSLFYFAINAGSLLSTTITPILRADVHCFGDKDCFSLAFSVPAMLMVISLVIFIAGKKNYVIQPPSGNMLVGVFGCIIEAIRRRLKEGKNSTGAHWLDSAEPKYGPKLVDDTKSLLKILVLYLPLPVFWALFDQQGSRWTFQATRLNGDIGGGFTIKPDQMQVVNPLLILAFIPFFNFVVYPLLSVIGIKRPLQKLTLGGLLAALAFVMSACLEYELESLDPKIPRANEAQFRVYNTMPCDYKFITSGTFKGNFSVPSMMVLQDTDLTLDQLHASNYTAYPNNPKECSKFNGVFNLYPKKATSFLMGNNIMQEFEDAPGKPKSGSAGIRIIANLPLNEEHNMILKGRNFEQKIDHTKVDLIFVQPGTYSLIINEKEVGELNLEIGSTTVAMIGQSKSDNYPITLFKLVEGNSIHIMWQLPQYIVITAAEVTFSVTGLEFAFTQAPKTMKSVLQACWLLTVAFGNFMVVFIAELKLFESQANEFLLFAALMVLDMLIFIILAMRYQYAQHHDDVDDYTVDVEPSNTDQPAIEQKGRHGHANKAFECDK